MRVIIAGSRDCFDYPELRLAIRETGWTITEVVSGGAKGVDRMGEKWADENDVPVRQFLPNWDLHGLAAGPIRNREMVNYAEALIALWNGSSKGTKNTITLARNKGLAIYVHRLDTSSSSRLASSPLLKLV